MLSSPNTHGPCQLNSDSHVIIYLNLDLVVMLENWIEELPIKFSSTSAQSHNLPSLSSKLNLFIIYTSLISSREIFLCIFTLFLDLSKLYTWGERPSDPLLIIKILLFYQLIIKNNFKFQWFPEEIKIVTTCIKVKFSFITQIVVLSGEMGVGKSNIL